MNAYMTCHKCGATDYFDRDALKDSGGLLYCDRHDSFMHWTDSVPWHAGEPHTYFAELPGYKLVQPKHITDSGRIQPELWALSGFGYNWRMVGDVNHESHIGKWTSIVFTEYDPDTDSDARSVGTFDNPDDAMLALWNAIVPESAEVSA